MQTKNASHHLANALQICIDHKAHKAGKLVQAHIFRTNQLSNTFLLNRLIELHSKCGDTAAALYLFDHMPQRNIYSYHAILAPYCKSNDLTNAYRVFDQMPEKDIISWNLMISLLSRNGPKEKAVESYYSMRLNGFMPTRFTLGSVFSACGCVGNLECGKECHGVAIKIGLNGNLYVGNALLNMYMKCESINDSFEVFNDLPERNEVSFTSMMEGLMKFNHLDKAFDMFGLMHREMIIDSISLSSVLGVCSKSKILGTQIHGLIIKLGLEKDLHINNSLLDMYAKCGYMELAEILFDGMTKVNVVSWNIMISAYGKEQKIETAIECVNRMQACGFEPNEVTYVNLLTVCLKCGDVENGLRIFNSMSLPSLTSWNAMLSGYSQNGFYKEALVLFREMQFENVGPDRTTFAVILSSCASIRLLEGGKQIHTALLKTEFCDDLYVATGLINVYSKCGEIGSAKCIFNNLSKYDIICCNSMLAGLLLNSLNNEVINLFNQMRVYGLLPTEFSYATILNSCSSMSSLSQGRQVHGSIAKNGHGDDSYVGSALIDMYCKCGNVGGAHQVFDTIPFKNTVTWNEMIHGYARNGHGADAVDLFEEMIQNNSEPDFITFVAVLTACSHSGLVDDALRVFDSMQREFGLEPSNDHYTCVIDCLGRAGRFNEVEEIIENMACKDNPIVWEVLLSSCRVHGNVILGRKAANELLRIDSSKSSPYALLANTYLSLGKWDDVNDVRGVMEECRVRKEPGYSWV